MDVGMFAELRHLSLTDPCPGEAVGSSQDIWSFQGEKYQSFVKSEEKIVISQLFFSLFTICKGRKLPLCLFFLSYKFSCSFFLLSFSLLDLAVFMPVDN